MHYQLSMVICTENTSLNFILHTHRSRSFFTLQHLVLHPQLQVLMMQMILHCCTVITVLGYSHINLLLNLL